MPTRRFTLEQAESLLPHLTHLLLEIRELKLQHDGLQERLMALSLRMRSNGHVLETQLAEARQAAEKTASALQGMIDRVHELGCELKDIEQGLVDFRTLKDGQEVYLCWRLGQPRIVWWHPLEAGFAGRRPLEMGKE